MSNLIRGEAVSKEETAENTTSGSTQRAFGKRVLRGNSVGMQRPVSLSVPAVVLSRATSADLQPTELLPPDLAAIEEASRLQGYNAGYEQGYSAGIAAAESAMRADLQRLSDLVRGIHQTHAAFFRAAERQVVDLALQIAQKVVEREIENMPDLAIGVIRAALEEMDARTAIRIRVHPDDAEVLRRRWNQVVPSGIAAERIELQPDDRIQTGGGVIETTHGQVDAQLDTKLAQLGNALWTFVMDVNNSQDGLQADA